ncbi:aldose 1-epimerase family protein [Tessaracoccus antarcticus]|uniref:Aldose epimerase n=1 Tax=Tessaracoccus antarcticus TaxID=2479848 RepID=A0A3M0G4A2_9ACTN|nr:aldose 1-epimerase family protein [Tessaracoccus antarcticus]RMB58927.1 aldose epimerase [Tessaracoccus antarcticus]
MMTNPTGEQYPISHGRYTAVVTEVGAHLRSLRVDGREWLWSFEADAAPVASQSKQLLPWPNRIRDGRYTFDGVEYQLPISEVPRHTALHGLNDGFAWQLISHTEQAVVQRHTFHPEAGWPGTLTATLTHSLSDDGLLVQVHVTNDGATPLPYGYGVHPYFSFDNVDVVTLELPFTTELRVDEDRLLPIALVPTTRGKDFQSPRALGHTVFDTAFTDPNTPRWTTRIAGGTHTIEVWADESLPWVQVYTRPERDAIAVEPMTCGPDAFNEGPTHDGLIVLAPEESHVAVWGLRAG